MTKSHLGGRCALAILSLCLLTQSVQAAFSFSSPDSRLRFMDSTAKFVVNTAITGYDGTLQVADDAVSRVQGSTITFNNGFLESGTLNALMTAQYDPTGADTIKLLGNNSLRCDTGTVLTSITASGLGNLISGQPQFTSSLVLTDSNTELQLSIQNQLNQNITLNGGYITLVDSLHLQDGVQITGVGRIKFNNNTLHFPGLKSTWNTFLYMDNPNDIELHSDLTLNTTWVFGPANGTSQINGNGYALDMSSGATLWIRSGHGLAMNDLHIKGLGMGYGWILFEDQNSTVSLSNTSWQLESNLTITTGMVYVNGDNCNIITSDKLLQFSLLGTLSVDNVVLYYGPLQSPDINNILPYPTNDNTNNSAPNVNLVNGGLIRPGLSTGDGHGGDITLLVSTYTLLNNEDLGNNRVLQVTGNYPTVSTVTINGAGYHFQLPRTTSPVINIANNITAVFTNVVLRDLQPQHFALGTGSKLIFGASTSIELGTDIDVNMSWTFNGGTSRIYGKGNDMNLSNQYAILVNPSTTLQIQDTRVTGVGGNTAADISRLRATSATSRIEAANSQFVMSEDFTFSSGYFDFDQNVKIEGSGHKWRWKSSKDMTINSQATLMFDRETIFSYESADTSTVTNRDHVIMADTTSRLYLNGCTLDSTTTGLKLQTGVLVIDDKVTVENQSPISTFGNFFDNGMDVEVLAGATIDVQGFLTYL